MDHAHDGRNPWPGDHRLWIDTDDRSNGCTFTPAPDRGAHPYGDPGATHLYADTRTANPHTHSHSNSGAPNRGTNAHTDTLAPNRYLCTPDKHPSSANADIQAQASGNGDPAAPSFTTAS